MGIKHICNKSRREERDSNLLQNTLTVIIRTSEIIKSECERQNLYVICAFSKVSFLTSLLLFFKIYIPYRLYAF
jgi:hypothetical protein